MPHIRFWVYDGILASGVSAPIDVLITANTLRARAQRRSCEPLFHWRIESLDGKPVRTASGQMLSVDGLLNARTAADAVVIAAPFVNDVRGFLQERRNALQPLLSGLQQQRARGAVLGCYCTGSFLFAEAGLLDGRLATTHWSKSREFIQSYPLVRVRASETLTDDDGIICSGAVTSYLNLALKVIEKLAGEDLAVMTARHLLIDTHRPSQFAYATASADHDIDHSDQLVCRAQRWMQENMRHPVRVAELASRLATSERTLARRFRRATGEAPLRYLQAVRIRAAKLLLETEDLSIDAVTEQVGYGDVSAFRELFKRETGLSPREYRRRFGRSMPEKAARS